MFESNEENILDDSLYVYDYLNKVIGIEEKNIIIFGRSMGSGPATHVASKRNPACLLLMSAFKSIRSIAQDQAGSILQYLIQDRFRNVDKISSVKSPTFLIHGMKDKLIACSHSQELHDKCGGVCSLVMPANMDHNDFDFNEDLITPFYHFLKQCKVSLREPKSAHQQMRIPDEYFVIPKAYQQLSIPASWACCCNPANNAQISRVVTMSNLSDGPIIYNDELIHGYNDYINEAYAHSGGKPGTSDPKDRYSSISHPEGKPLDLAHQIREELRFGNKSQLSIQSRRSSKNQSSVKVKSAFVADMLYGVGSQAKNRQKESFNVQLHADLEGNKKE